MKLMYYRDERGNFGDDLNPWLWERLLPGFLDDRDDVLLVVIGTILNHAIPAEPVKVVFGSGVGYGNLPILDDRWRWPNRLRVCQSCRGSGFHYHSTRPAHHPRGTSDHRAET